MSESLDAAISRVEQELRRHDVVVPEGWHEALTRAFAPHRLNELDEDHGDQLVQAHFSAMNAVLDNVTSILRYQSMMDLFSRGGSKLKPSFARAGKNQFTSRTVIASKLASNYFHEGRQLVSNELTEASGAWLLERCVKLIVNFVSKDERASGRARLMYSTQVATASAHLARVSRDDSDRKTILLLGLEYSLAAELLDHPNSDQDGYQIELALKLYELDSGDSLDRISSALGRSRFKKSVQLRGLLGDVAAARASTLLANGDASHAVPLLSQAIGHYDVALALPADSSKVDLGYLLAKRGRAHALLYERGGGAFGRRDNQELVFALRDWTDPTTAPHRHDREVARLHLARSRLALARSDRDAAEVDILHADRLLQTDPHHRTEVVLRSQRFDIELNSAMDANSTTNVGALLAQTVELDLSVPVPAGSMTKAIEWLRNRWDRVDWEPLAVSVLGRIEEDVDHPALSDSARGYVASHAGQLARQLYSRGTGNIAGLTRAVDVSRLQIGLARPVSARALDGAASVAFALATELAASEEAASEDTLGAWTDSMLWSVAALETERTVRTSVESRFDVVACAVRVVRAAAMLRDLTGEHSPASSASEALELAATLVEGPDPRLAQARASLTGEQSKKKNRRASMPQGVLSEIGLTSASSAAPVHDAWRSLQEAEKSVGSERTRIRQVSADRFFALATDSSRDLGGKRRGGQRGVTTLSEPHGLAGQVVVLKRVSPESAHHEFNAFRHLEAWLESSAVSPSWRIPTPLGVIDLSGDGIFIMRRISGHTLAHHAMQHFDGRAEHPLRMFEEAVSALADFHTAMTDFDLHARKEDVEAGYLRAAEALTSSAAATRAAAMISEITANGPYLAKKDAHAGNWIWSAASGGLVLFDVEGKTSRPMLLELATLLDDLPLLALDDDGWARRVELGRRYLSRMPRILSADITDSDIRARLEAGALNTAVVGLSRYVRRDWGVSSLGIRFAREQRNHYVSIIDHLAATSDVDAIRRAAQEVDTEAIA